MKFLCVAIIWLVSCIAHGADVYFAPSPLGEDNDDTNIIGSGLNRGSSTYPYQTLNYAISQSRTATLITAGDTAWAMDGMHLDGNGQATLNSATHVKGTGETNRITIKAKPGDTPVFEYQLRLESGMDYVTIDGIAFSQNGKVKRAPGIKIGEAILPRTVTDIDGNGTTATATTSVAHGYSTNDLITILGSTNFDGDYFITTSGGSTFTFSHASSAVNDSGTSYPDIIQNTTIQNSTFRNLGNITTRALDVIRANNFKILNNTFDNIRTRSQGNDAYAVATRAVATNGEIAYNRFTDIGANAIITTEEGSNNLDAAVNNIDIHHNTIGINDPYQYRDVYGETYGTPPAYQFVTCDASDVDINTGIKNITSTTTDLSGFIAGDSVTINGTGGANDLASYLVTEASTINEIKLYETPQAQVTNAAACTIESFAGNYAGEHGIVLKTGDSNMTIRDNLIYGMRKCDGTERDCSGSDGIAIVVTQKTEHADIYRNRIRDNTRGIIFAVWDPGPTVTLAQSSVYSNLIYDVASPTAPISFTASAPQPMRFVNLRNLDVYNNTIDYGNNTAVNVLTTGGNNTTFTLRNNLFMSGAGGVTAGVDTITTDTNLWGTNITELSNHQDAGDVNGDPSISQDYKPVLGASNVGTGTVISGGGTDFRGKNFKNPPSIGAYERYVY